MAHLKSLRKHLLYLLTEGGAHATFEDAVKDVPPAARGTKPEGAAHTLWELLEHMRIAQEDILDFSRNPSYKEKKWPDAYWPTEAAPPSENAWTKCIQQFESDLHELQELLAALAAVKGRAR